MANSSNAPGAPGVPGSGLVTEDDIARMTGLDVSQVRLMISGNVPIPPHLQGVIPKPATEITGYVWRPEDVAGLPERLAEAKERQRREMAEQMRVVSEPAPAPEPAAPVDENRGPRVSESVFRFQEKRDKERQDATERFGTNVDDLGDSLLPVGPRKRDRPGWLSGLKSAWTTARAPEADLTDALPEGLEPEPAAPIVQDGSDVIVTSGSNSRRTRTVEQDALFTQKQDLKAERSRQAAERAEARAAAKMARAEQKATKGRKGDADDPVDGPATEPLLDDASLAGLSKSEARRQIRDDAKAAKEASKARKKNVAVAKKPVKPTAAEKKEARAVELETKKRDKADAKAAKVVRDAAYKEALERWKQDVKVAKETGTRPPRKPKRPKNDTSKPKPIDVNNAVRALATMLENSPGELESIRVMAKEYEGTQIGEAFRRIQHRISDQNASMVEAFAPETVFPTEVHNMLAVGQKTIAPGPALRTAVKLMDASNDAKRKLKSEIMEPASVGALSLVALFATAYGVMPSFVEMYNSLEMEVPPVSAAILVMSDVTVWVLGSMFGAAVAYMIWWFAYGRKWDKWRTWLDAYSLHMPLMGTANMTQQTYQLLKILGAYINVGAPEREALVDAAAATKNRAIKKHLLTTAELMMAGRRTFAGTFEADMFPSMAKNILGIGEQAGRVPEAILDLEKVYEREAEVASEQAVARVSGTVAGISSLIFTVVVTMVTVPPLEMFGSTLSYGQ
ncbi:MAG: type II secretion system F family protein [Microbacterium sp.]|uniref:type II secretion system F family protein n=1 Tax=Microbacterium sp. TaxID=51671 RepID=UPI001AC8DA58|nr:type II secretion system F family protein [Microbacterium sp.]MBN9214842.1 type II secretion system F family protein [Microbacterium sp.]